VQNRVTNLLIVGARTGLEHNPDSNGGGAVVRNLTVANIELNAANPMVSGIPVYINGHGRRLLENVLTVNGHYGLVVAQNISTAHRVRNAVLAGSEVEPLVLNNSANINLSGVVKLGRESMGPFCASPAGSMGLNPDCTTESPSDFVLSTGILDTGIFVGPVTADAVNTSDTNGSANFAGDLDWTFENSARGWSKAGVTPWPGSDHRGGCATGNTCEIVDFSLAAGNTSALGINTVPTGNDVVFSLDKIPTGTPVSQAGCDVVSPGSTFATNLCEATFLRDAVEVSSDNIGDDDTLCESGETCIFSPNAGYYQGHGNLVDAGFVNGTLTGITLLRYENNGR
jgi:hypothetical protein